MDGFTLDKQPVPLRGMNPDPTQKRGYYGRLAFFLSLFIMLGAYALYGAFPFGDRHSLLIDEFHQYAPFLGELRRKLLGTGSFFYSWDSGLGYNFWANLAYYGASPFNLLLVLFPPEFLTEAMLFLTVVKVAFSALTMQYFLRRAYGGNGLLGVALGVAYSLSGFVMAYSWNVMWLDTLVFLPLAALGLSLLVREKRAGLYIVALALIIFSNFYTGGFACFFLGLYFFYIYARFAVEKGFAAWLRSALRFIVASLIAALCAAVLLLPTYYNLQITSAAGDAFPAQFSLVRALVTYFTRLFLFAKPAVMSGLPNIYAGLSVLLLLPVYAACSAIRQSARVIGLALVAFFFFSFNLNVLNFIWHGFHYPNSLDYRYAFLFVFLVLGLCFDGLSAARKVPAVLPVMSAFLAALLLLLLELQLKEDVSSVMVLGSLCFLPLLLLAWLRYFRLPEASRLRLRAGFLLMILLVAESFANTFYSFYINQQSMPYGPRNGYAAGEMPDEIREAAVKLGQRSEGFYRAAMEPPYTTNDGALYGYPALDVFCSTYPHAPVKFMKQLGYQTNGVNSIAHRGASPVLDSLFGIRYLLRKNNEKAPADSLRQLVLEGTHIRVWENPESQGLGFFVPAVLPEGDYAQLDPLEAQSAFARDLGCSDQLYRFVDNQFRVENAAAGEAQAPPVTAVPNDLLSISKSVERVHFIVPQSAYYVLGWNASAGDISAVRAESSGRDGFYLGRLSRGMGELGYLESGTRVDLIFEQKAEQQASVKLRLGLIDADTYRTDMAKLKAGGLTLDRWNAGRNFAGQVEASQAGYLFLSLPYDEGWKLLLDGQAVRPQKLMGAFMAVPLTAGLHRLEASFIPQGFKLGAILSLVGLVLLCLRLLWERRRRRVLDSAGSLSSAKQPAVVPAFSDAWLSGASNKNGAAAYETTAAHKHKQQRAAGKAGQPFADLKLGEQTKTASESEIERH